MATITGATNEKVYSIPKWLGLNEHPDGDTNLKLGEASVMQNWKVTRDGNLKRRPGTEFFAGLSESYTIVAKGSMLFATGLKGSDHISVYSEVSADAVPGTVTLVGSGGVVENGVYSINNAVVTDGVLESDSENLNFVVSNGVLQTAGYSDEITVEQLAELVDTLGEDEYLYTRYNEKPYRLRNGSVIKRGNLYDIGGNLLVAEADDAVSPVAGLWFGVAGGKQVLLAACGGRLWSLYDADNDVVSRTPMTLTTINTDKGVNFIPFDNKVYIQNGYEYYVYDGITVDTVSGYIPLVAVSIGPQGGQDAGELTAEYINLLNNKRRVWLSPDGDTNKTFKLPEPAKTIDSVKYLDGSTAPTYTFTANTDEITFTSTLSAAVNSIEVSYSVKTHSDDAAIPDYRAQVTAMRFCEIFSGGTDSALFFYGNGTNKAIYTGMDYDGMPRPDYFPDQYEVLVGDANTPITSLIRHYAVLIAYKPDSAWALNFGTTELATGDLTVAIHVTPVNRDKGNDAPGQVRLVNNNPVTCSGSELYQWTNSSYYTSNLTRDERQARRISDRIQKTIKEIDFKHCCMWDDNDNQEFYISGNGKTLVWNYVTDCWYEYTGLDVAVMCNFQGDVIIGRSDGKVVRLTYNANTDSGAGFDAVWQSGSMDFGASNMRKYSSMMWVAVKPEAGASVDVDVITDRKDTFREKVVSADKAKVPGQPFVVRSKIKAKKFVFYKLLFKTDSNGPAITIMNVNFRVRQTGYSK